MKSNFPQLRASGVEWLPEWIGARRLPRCGPGALEALRRLQPPSRLRALQVSRGCCSFFFARDGQYLLPSSDILLNNAFAFFKHADFSMQMFRRNVFLREEVQPLAGFLSWSTKERRTSSTRRSSSSLRVRLDRCCFT